MSRFENRRYVAPVIAFFTSAPGNNRRNGFI